MTAMEMPTHWLTLGLRDVGEDQNHDRSRQGSTAKVGIHTRARNVNWTELEDENLKELNGLGGVCYISIPRPRAVDAELCMELFESREEFDNFSEVPSQSVEIDVQRDLIRNRQRTVRNFFS